MKTRVLIIIGIVIVAVSLSYYVIYDSSTTVFVSCDPRYGQIDGKCVLLKPEQYCTDWCDLQELSSLGCNQLVLDYIYRYTNLFDEKFDGVYYRNFVGLPDGVSNEKLQECTDFIREKRTSTELENLLCMGGRGMILNEDCERIGKYDPATGLPIVENKEQCDMLDGDWDEKQNICDSKYDGK